jgi:hypothetical protein
MNTFVSFNSDFDILLFSSDFALFFVGLLGEYTSFVALGCSLMFSANVELEQDKLSSLFVLPQSDSCRKCEMLISAIF